MLLATALERIFIINNNGQEIRLPDPEPHWSAETVLNFFSGKYPILTTATISKPKINDDRVEIRFESVMGTKG